MILTAPKLKYERMIKVMAKIIKLLLTLTLTISLCGCDLLTTIIDVATSPSSDELDTRTETLYEQTTQAILNKDNSKLYELFCAENQTSETTDEINEFLTSIGEDITSFGEHNLHKMPIHFVYDSTDYAIKQITSNDVLTAEENVYTLNIVMCVNAKDNKDYVGLQYISLCKDKNKICEIGTIIENYTPNEIPKKYKEIDTDQLLSAEIQEEYISNMLYFLNKKDKDGFVSLFSEDLKDTAENKFEEITTLIDGKMKTYSDIDTGAGAGGNYKYDHWEVMDNDVTVYDILADNGNMYEISVSANFINLKEPDEEGIRYFSIRLVENQINGDLEHDVIQEIAF